MSQIVNKFIANGTISLATKVTGTLPIANGGTGQTSAANAFGAISPLTTKGDVLAYSTTNIRLPVGTNGQLLSADSAQASGLSWISPAATGANTTLSNLGITAVNANINPATDNAITLGDATHRWNAIRAISIRGDNSSPIIDVQTGTLSDSGGGGLISINYGTRILENAAASTLLDWSGTHPSLNSHKLINVSDPTSAQDAATKAYVDASPSGTVTSVALSVPTFLSVSGSPVTSSGTLAVTLSGTALPIANGGTGQTSATAAFNSLSPSTTKGDLITNDGTNDIRLPVGTNGFALIADSTQTAGIKWAAQGSGANTALSNLTTTAINQNLIFDIGAPAELRTLTVDSADSQNLAVKSGDVTTTGNSGSLSIGSGVGPDSSGTVLISSGDSSAGSSGGTTLKTGSTVDSTSGQAIVQSGDASGTGATGYLYLITGNSTSGNSGNVFLNPGNSATGPGYVAITGGSSSTTSINGGDVNINGGNSGTDGNSGGVIIGSGSTGGTGNSGNITITTASSANGISGNVIVQPGQNNAGAYGQIQLLSGLVLLNENHIRSTQTTAPTAAPTAAAGTGASCSVSTATDIAGNISLTTTAIAGSSGAVANITFDKPYSVAPIVVATPTNAAAGQNTTVQGVYFTTSTTVLTINFAVADITGRTYTWAYHLIET